MNQTVSVVIPCYNSERYLRQTVESVLQQTRRPAEIIAVDDGSTDGTRAILEGYGQQVSILVHPSKANRGVGASLSLGVAAAKGDLVAFLDHDDWWDPMKLAEQVAAFEEQPDVGLVYTNVMLVDPSGKHFSTIYPAGYVEHNDPRELLLRCYITTASSVAVRRRIFESVGLFDDQLIAADHDMWLRIIETNRFHYVPKCLAYHRKHPTQQSSRRSIWEDGFPILEKAARRYSYGESTRRKRMAVLNYRLGQHDLKSRHYLEAAKHFLLSGRYDPLRSVRYLLSRRIT